MTPASIYDDGYLVLDSLSHECTVAGKFVNLTKIEWQILDLLTSYAGHVVLYETIIEAVWQVLSSPSEYILLQTHISNLRGKLKPGYPIATVRSYGYRYDTPDAPVPVPAWRPMSRPTLQESTGVPTPQDRWQRYDG